MGFAETGATNLKNNRRIVSSKPKMNDAHLNIRKTKKASQNSYRKMSEEDLEKFREELSNNRKIEKKRTAIILSFVLIIATAVILFLRYQ